MDKEQIKEIIDDSYDDSKEYSIVTMAKDFYNRKMWSIVVLVWVWAVIFIGGAVYSAIRFFGAEETKQQIMYASIFVPCVLAVGFLKVLAWEMINRNNIKREIKRLELRIAELSEAIKNK